MHKKFNRLILHWCATGLLVHALILMLIKNCLPPLIFLKIKSDTEPTCYCNVLPYENFLNTTLNYLNILTSAEFDVVFCPGTNMASPRPEMSYPGTVRIFFTKRQSPDLKTGINVELKSLKFNIYLLVANCNRDQVFFDIQMC